MDQPRYDLRGRIAFISGASAGIGAHLARLYAAAGAAVVLGARRIERCEALAAQIGSEGGRALAVALDVAQEPSVIAAYDAAEAAFGAPDVVVANAGIGTGGRSTDVPLERLRALVDTNFTGLYLTVREGAKRMIAAGSRESQRGRIILIGSMTAHMSNQGDAAYAALKAGVEHLGRQFAREWIRLGINVNTVHPGIIPTASNADWFAGARGQAQVAGLPRRRLVDLGALDDIMLLLASDASRQLTGTAITIDDGQSL
ncbi:MAG TPA: SDR family oxidoreductase [Pseudomonadales bacterium]|nr:SDR family oxidoreductase [Pseudomonadales bacterium]